MRVYYWLNGEWCLREELEEKLRENSDNFGVFEVNEDSDEYQIEEIVKRCIIGVDHLDDYHGDGIPF